ncbi:MAG: LpxI family protein [Planctomycetota bacterium]|nr:MAG: LpxI family protein [Planctomycetota bacterium]
MTSPQVPSKVGLIAGWGRYPMVVAEALVRQGIGVYGLGIRDHCDPDLAKLCQEFDWIGLGQIGKVVRFFRRHGVTEATMAGKVHKVRLFTRWAWLHHLPDWRGLLTYYPHFISRSRTTQDDSLLGTIVGSFGRAGITMKPATDFAPELLVKLACLTSRRPNAAQQQDIDFGWKLAKEMGRLDIGQSVAVKNRSPLAIEAIEGTDECIRRAGALCAAGGFVLVKVAKPQQDMRFDVPTIGIGTLETLADAGGKVLAVEAGRTIIIDEPRVIEFANQRKLVVVALDEASRGALAPERMAG